MNILNFKPLNLWLAHSLKKYSMPDRIFKYLPHNWQDSEGNNLYHYAALHHDDYLFEQALLNQADINGISNKGIMPIHRFIERGFIYPHAPRNNKWKEVFAKPEINKVPVVQGREGMGMDFNKPLLKKFIMQGANVNAFSKNALKSEMPDKGEATYSKNNNLGSPIELLISFFMIHVLTSTFDNKEILQEYNDVYGILSQAGANINLIMEQRVVVENETIIDSTQIKSSDIVSHFFTVHIMNNKDCYALLPILADPNVSFSLRDDNGNTLLHHLFGRLKAKYKNIDKYMVELMFRTIWENPSFKQSDLEVENSFRLKPLALFRGESADYAKLFSRFMLAENLNTALAHKPGTGAKKKTKI